MLAEYFINKYKVISGIPLVLIIMDRSS